MRGDFVKLIREATEEEVRIANSTSRSSPAVGMNAIVPKYVLSIAKPSQKILDFGAGKTAMHTAMLRDNGLDVVAYDFGSNTGTNLHDPNALSKQYDIVYASNVLNVQSSPEMLQETLTQIFDVVKTGGVFIGNYPMSPRKIPDMKSRDLEGKLAEIFRSVRIVGGTRSTPIFECSK